MTINTTEPQNTTHWTGKPYREISPTVKQECLHDKCSECNGTGQRKLGGLCIHALSCPCPKCTPIC